MQKIIPCSTEWSKNSYCLETMKHICYQKKKICVLGYYNFHLFFREITFLFMDLVFFYFAFSHTCHYIVFPSSLKVKRVSNNNCRPLKVPLNRQTDRYRHKSIIQCLLDKCLGKICLQVNNKSEQFWKERGGKSVVGI